MPFNPTQLAQGANATLETYRRNDPIDQVNTAHEVLKWLLKNKKPSTFGNGFYNETVYFTNASNYQNYFGADQVTYNEREQTRFAKFSYYNHHDGFWFDEDRLAANNIILTDDGDAQVSDSEMQQLVNLLETSYYGLKEGINEGMADEFLLDGSTNPKAVPGLDHLISTNPTVGIVGGINAANAAYWRNNTNLGLATGQALIDGMEKTWRDCTRFGGMVPDYIPCGSSFLDAYRIAAGQTINRQINDGGNAKGGITLDASVSGTFFKGVPLVWDPTFDALDAKLGAIANPWAKRCYFLNSKTIKLRPLKGHWMVTRRPERLPDRYVHYFGQTSKYGMTINKRNANAVLSVA